MLQVSDGAKEMLKTSLDDGHDEGQVYRLVLDGDRLALGVSSIEEGDMVYELDGAPVLAAPHEIVDQVEGTIEVQDSGEGARLILST